MCSFVTYRTSNQIEQEAVVLGFTQNMQKALLFQRRLSTMCPLVLFTNLFLFLISEDIVATWEDTRMRDRSLKLKLLVRLDINHLREHKF